MRDDIRSILGDLDLRRLQKTLQQEGFGPIPVAIGDLFAVGCYFVHEGRREVGFKLCRTALRAYDLEESLEQRILRSIEGDEKEMSGLLNPHVELPGRLFTGGTG